MDPYPRQYLEAYEEISAKDTQPLPLVRSQKTYQRILVYLLGLIVMIAGIILVVLLFGFPFPNFGVGLKWIRYVRRRKMAEEIRPWYRQTHLVVICTYALGWALLGAHPTFQTIGSTVMTINPFFFVCFVCLFVYCAALITQEIQTDDSSALQERKKQAQERINALRLKAMPWIVGPGVLLLGVGIFISLSYPALGFHSSLVILPSIGELIAWLGGFIVVVALFFSDDLIGIYLRV